LSPSSLPPSPFLGRLIYRSVAFWLLGRIMLALSFALMAQPALELRPVTRIALLAVVGVAVWLDLRRRGEEVILTNLGVSRWGVMAVALPAPLAGELLLYWLLGV